LPLNAGGYQNNFDHGIEIHNVSPSLWPDSPLGTAQGSMASRSLTSWFKDRFLSDQPIITLPANENNNVLAGTVAPIVLPAATAPAGYTLGPAKGDYRPTLVYNADGTVNYYYRNAAGTYVNDNTTIGDCNGKVVRATQDINVMGWVKGKTTLVTDDGKSPVIVANAANPGLVYSTYVPATATIPSTETSVIGIVSGNNIVINHQWIDLRTATPSTIVINSILPTTTKTTPAITNKKFLHINAALVATETAASSIFVDLTVGTLTFGFSIFQTGSTVCQNYRAQADAANGTVAGNVYAWDQRLIHDVSYPNQTLVTCKIGVTDNLVLSFFNWVATTQSM
jgi:hypothetical protein